MIAGAWWGRSGDVVACRHRTSIKSGRFGASSGRVHRLGAAVDDVIMERILEMALRLRPEQSNEIALVLAEEQAIRRFELNGIDAQIVVLREHHPSALILQRRFVAARRPAPDVAEPGLGEEIDQRIFGTAVVYRRAPEHVF